MFECCNYCGWVDLESFCLGDWWGLVLIWGGDWWVDDFSWCSEWYWGLFCWGRVFCFCIWVVRDDVFWSGDVFWFGWVEFCFLGEFVGVGSDLCGDDLFGECWWGGWSRDLILYGFWLECVDLLGDFDLWVF